MSDPITQKHIAEVDALGRRVGYGFMMAEAQYLWREALIPKGLEGGELIVGPCVSQTVKCPCVDKRDMYGGSCDYCAGCGWLTKAVYEKLKEILWK